MLVCRLGKTREGFLGLTKEGVEPEYNHIVKSDNRVDRDTEIQQLNSEGLSGRKISEKIGISYTQVRRILKKADDSSQSGTCSTSND